MIQILPFKHTALLLAAMIFGMTSFPQPSFAQTEGDRLQIICDKTKSDGITSAGEMFVLEQLDASLISGTEFMRVGLRTNDQTPSVAFSLRIYDGELTLENGQTISAFISELIDTQPKEYYEGTADH